MAEVKEQDRIRDMVEALSDVETSLAFIVNCRGRAEYETAHIHVKGAMQSLRSLKVALDDADRQIAEEART
jgi:hypothetical protein